MEALQEYLYQTSAGEKTMERSDYERRRDADNLELVEDADKSGRVASSGPPPQETVERAGERLRGGKGFCVHGRRGKRSGR